jgi:hypothetical protein
LWFFDKTICGVEANGEEQTEASTQNFHLLLPQTQMQSLQGHVTRNHVCWLSLPPTSCLTLHYGYPLVEPVEARFMIGIPAGEATGNNVFLLP